MKRLVDRARAAMNLVLVATLLVIWAIFNTGPDVTGLGTDIFVSAQSVVKHQPGSASSDQDKPDAISDFVELVDVQEIDDTPLSAALTMAEHLETTKPFAIPFLAPTGLNKQADRGDSDEALATGQDASEAATLPDFSAQTGKPGKIASSSDSSTGSRNFELSPRMKELQATILAAAREAIFDLTRTPEENRLMELLEQLDQIIDDWDLNTELTFGKAQDTVTEKIKIPIIEQELGARSAPIIVIAALVIPLLYLASVCKTMTAIAANESIQEKELVRDWIFFHTGLLGPFLGIAWILLPAAAVGAGLALGTLETSVGIQLMAFIAPASMLAVYTAWRARKSHGI